MVSVVEEAIAVPAAVAQVKVSDQNCLDTEHIPILPSSTIFYILELVEHKSLFNFFNYNG